MHTVVVVLKIVTPDGAVLSLWKSTVVDMTELINLHV